MYASQENVQTYASLSIPSARAEQISSARFVSTAKRAHGGGCLSSTLARRYSRVPILRYLLLGFCSTGFRSTGFRSTGFRSTGYRFMRHQSLGYQARSFIRFFITTFISSLWRWNSSLHAHICALRGKRTRFCQHAPDETHRFFVVGMRVQTQRPSSMQEVRAHHAQVDSKRTTSKQGTQK